MCYSNPVRTTVRGASSRTLKLKARASTLAKLLLLTAAKKNMFTETHPPWPKDAAMLLAALTGVRKQDENVVTGNTHSPWPNDAAMLVVPAATLKNARMRACRMNPGIRRPVYMCVGGGGL